MQKSRRCRSSGGLQGRGHCHSFESGLPPYGCAYSPSLASPTLRRRRDAVTRHTHRCPSQTRIEEKEYPKDEWNLMRAAHDKLNANKFPFDDKLFTLLLLRSFPDSYGVTVQIRFTKTKTMSVTAHEVSFRGGLLRTQARQPASRRSATFKKDPSRFRSTVATP